MSVTEPCKSCDNEEVKGTIDKFVEGKGYYRVFHCDECGCGWHRYE